MSGPNQYQWGYVAGRDDERARYAWLVEAARNALRALHAASGEFELYPGHPGRWTDEREALAAALRELDGEPMP